jgi:spermidine synthase
MKIEKTPTPKKVMVVGGGPGGWKRPGSPRKEGTA